MLSLRQSLDLPPLWLLGYAALAWGLARAVPIGLGAWTRPLGQVLVVAGIVLAVVALLEFRRHATSFVPHRDPSALITTGVYRYSRNPIYLADAVILAGLCLWWQAPLSLVVVPAFVATITARFIRPEEARLRAAFGPAFEAWATRTRRWL